MRSLSLDQLKALEAVADTGSFTAAARRLNLSQSAVSVQIRELEERFGVRLLERLGKRAFATPAGQEVIDHARRMFQEAEAIASGMRRRRGGWMGRVRLGAAPNVLTYLLPPVLKSLRETYPGLELSIRTGITRDMTALVMRNELELTLATLPVEERGFSISPWRRDRMVAVLPAEAGNVPDTVTPEYLARWPIILDGRSRGDRMAREWLRRGGAEPQVVMEIGNPEGLRNLVGVGLGASILGPEVVEGAAALASGVQVRPLAPELIRETAFVLRQDKVEDEALKAVREALMTLATQ